MKKAALPDLAHLAQGGADIACRVTPGARQNSLEAGTPIRIRVTAPAEDGRATEAARRLLARALGVAPTRLTLQRGTKSRDKLFRLD